LFEAGNSAALRERLLVVLDSPDRLEAMGDAARAFALENFSDDGYHRRLMGLYEETLQQPD
jgi:glycosyltransferase involved in cell wall biosynthesis